MANVNRIDWNSGAGASALYHLAEAMKDLSRLAGEDGTEIGLLVCDISEALWETGLRCEPVYNGRGDVAFYEIDPLD